MPVTVYRNYSAELDEETGIEPLVYLCEACQRKHYAEDDLDKVGDSDTAECDECGA